MFEKLRNIDFEKLNNFNFDEKIKVEMNIYLETMKNIYDIFNKFELYSTLLSQQDNKLLTNDIECFSSTLINIQDGITTKINDKILNKEKFNNKYLINISELQNRYEHFKLFINKTITDNNESLKKIQDDINLKANENNKVLELKDNEIASINKKIEDRNFEISKLKLEIQKKDLNKLAEAFYVEENKYKNGKKWPINFGFLLLSIPSLFTIYLVLSAYIDNQFFNILDIKKFDIYSLIPFAILTLVLWYSQYFQLKNYYINRDLETNFSNRKAIANSFKGLLELVHEEGENLGDKSLLISKFIEKVSDILYSEIDTSYIKKHNDDVPVSKLLETVNELIKKIK